MASKPYKFKTSVAAATVTSEKLNLNFSGYNRRGQKHNAYRIKALKIQIDDFDAEADGDSFKIQLNYDDKATMDTIDEEDEILTLGEQANVPSVGTNAGPGVHPVPGSQWFDKLRNEGILYLDGKDFIDVYIVEETFYVLMLNAGQDAAEEFHVVIKGNYVHLDPDEVKMRKEGVTLT